MERAEKTLRATWETVKSDMWNELGQGRTKAILLLGQSVQFLGLSDRTVLLASKWGWVKACTWG